MAKKEKTPRILAIDPGTKKIEIVILEGKQIIYSAVMALKRRSVPHELLDEARNQAEKWMLRVFSSRK